MKQITVFGANGNIGSRVVRLLLTKKYRVRAFVRGEHSFESHPNLEIVQGDIYDMQRVADAIKGSTVVISALGSWGTPKKDILSSAMKVIIPAMEQQRIKRIVTLTGSDARIPQDKPNIFHKLTHWLLSKFAPKILEDGELHLKLLRQSNLNWTTVRSPIMTNKGLKGEYELRYALPGPFASIARDDVAAALVWLAETGEYARRAPFIYRH